MDSVRGSWWSITINNPNAEDELRLKKVKEEIWFIKFTSQNEIGKNGTPHIQGCLQTRQVRMACIKKAFPRAHIELAKKPLALIAYVQKTDTAVSKRDEIKTTYMSPSTLKKTLVKSISMEMVDKRYMEQISKLEACHPGTQEYWYQLNKVKTHGECFMMIVDELISEMIMNGTEGIEFIGASKCFRDALMLYWVAFLKEKIETPTFGGNTLITQTK